MIWWDGKQCKGGRSKAEGMHLSSKNHHFVVLLRLLYSVLETRLEGGGSSDFLPSEPTLGCHCSANETGGEGVGESPAQRLPIQRA